MRAIRLEAGLTKEVPPPDKTVGAFVADLADEDQERKIIVDPKGEAHTLVLEFVDGTWKRFDNDAPPEGSENLNYERNKIRETWE